jgi:hypothetical protein
MDHAFQSTSSLRLETPALKSPSGTFLFYRAWSMIAETGTTE